MSDVLILGRRGRHEQSWSRGACARTERARALRFEQNGGTEAPGLQASLQK